MSASLTRIMVVSISLCWCLFGKTHLNDLVDPSVSEKLAIEAQREANHEVGVMKVSTSKDNKTKEELEAAKRTNTPSASEIAVNPANARLTKADLEATKRTNTPSASEIAVNPANARLTKADIESAKRTNTPSASEIAVNPANARLTKADHEAKLHADAPLASEVAVNIAVDRHALPYETLNEGPQLSREDLTNFEPGLWDGIERVNQSSRDGVVDVVVSTDSYCGEVGWILLDTANWWAWGSDGWVMHSCDGDPDTFTAGVADGNYMFILGDTYGDGGATADISVNGEAVASISTSWEDPYSDLSGFYEAQITFDVAAAPLGVPVAIQACTDYYPSESAFIVLDTTNYWAWGSDGWVTFSSAFECIDMNFDDLPFGDYLLILGDTYGDGGMSYSVTVDEDPAVTGVVTSCDVSPYSGLCEFPVAFTSAESVDCASGVYDCAGVCDGDAVEDCLGECGGDASGLECTCEGNLSWSGDGWCDGANNNEGCGFDGGDCCPGDCVSGTYDCASYGGTCDDCLDPATSDFSEGGACYEEPPATGAPVAIQACTDYYPSESAFIVLDTTNYWAWGSDGWVTFSSAFECIDMNFDDLPFGDYLLILGDTYGDGGMSYSVTVDEDPAITGVVTSCDVSPYSGLCEFPVAFTSAESVDCASGVYDCAGVCDGDAVEDCLGECGGDASGIECTCEGYLSYIGDGWCDGANNNEGCGFDGGDCCPGDCVSGTYDCASYGGTCDDCIDPATSDFSEGGACYEEPPATGAPVAIQACTDYYPSESAFIVLDTTNYWAWGSDGWVTFSSAFECIDMNFDDLPFGDYLLILGDTYGDGGMSYSVTVDEDPAITGVVTSCDVSPYSGLCEFPVAFTSAESEGCASGVYDCAGVCDGDAVEDCLGECGGDASGLECTCEGNLSWLGDGYCDGANNNEGCGFDAGDCCPGDCVSGTYDCASFGGTCDDCVDPASADLAEGGACYEAPATGAPVAIQACTDYYPSESAFIVLDTTNYWAWGSDGWVTFSSAFECIDMNFDDLPFGDYLLILGDTYGDGGMSYSVTVDTDAPITGVVTSCDVSPYSGLCEFPVAFTSAESVDCASGVYDCAGVCDGDAVEDCLGECGGDASGIECTCEGNASWLGDGWCDDSNNNEGCGFDAGDCCPGDCVSGTYDCAQYGGTCDDCIDPASADLAAGGLCEGCADGEVECWDGSCAASEEDCPAIDGCVYDWSAYGAADCDAAWTDFAIDCATLESNYGWDCLGCECPGDVEQSCGDGVCTGDETYGSCPEDCEPTCEDLGQVTCSDGSCADTAEDCADYACVSAGGNGLWLADGWCDAINNIPECGYDNW